MNITAAPPPPVGNITPNGSFILPNAKADHTVCVPSYIMAKVYSSGWLSADPPDQNCLSLLMIQLPVIILVTKSIHSLLRPLNQPRFVCDVIGGLILGKSGLGAFDWFWDFLVPLKCALMQRTFATVAVMLYLFLAGVKADPWSVVQSGKKAGMVGAVSQLLPFMVVNAWPMFVSIGGDNGDVILRSKFFVFLGASISVTAAPVVGDTLADLRILNTDLGRLGMSSAIVSDVFGWFFMVLFIVYNQSQVSSLVAVYAVLSLLAMVTVIAGVLGPYMRHIVRQTKPGARIPMRQLVLLLIALLVVGLMSDASGVSFMLGPLMMGLFVPAGPPLGYALVQGLELMVEEVLLPLLLTMGTGLIDVWALKSFSRWWQLQLIVLAGYTAKLVGAMLPALYCEIPTLSAFLLGLIMNFRGLIEMLTFIKFKRGTLLDDESYAIMMLSTTVVTAIAAPMVSKLYNPLITIARPVTIQKLGSYEELRMLVCVHTKSHVSTMLDLLEASCSPLCAYVLHIVELAGRASSTLISHRNKKGYFNPEGMSRLFDAFINYEQDMRGQVVSVQPFSAVVPFKTMHRDVLALAAQKHIALILVPFLRGDVPHKPTKADLALRSMTTEILAQAPCSVGIVVHHGLSRPLNTTLGNFRHHVGVFFWGGPDDREAFMYAARMARHPGVTLNIIRFMPDPGDMDWRREDELLLRSFNIVNSGNDKVVIEEISVTDLQQTFSVIRSKGHKYDLVIVGRKQEGAPLLEEGLEEWSEFPDLGVVGDMLASSDFKCRCSVLVVQQYRSCSKLDTRKYHSSVYT